MASDGHGQMLCTYKQRESRENCCEIRNVYGSLGAEIALAKRENNGMDPKNASNPQTSSFLTGDCYEYCNIMGSGSS